MLKSPQCPENNPPQARAQKNKTLAVRCGRRPYRRQIVYFSSPARNPADGARPSTQRGPEDRGGFAFRSETLIEAKGFHAHDGTAISLARLGGIKTGLITKRVSETVALRARDLKLEYVYQGIEDKLGVFRRDRATGGIRPRPRPLSWAMTSLILPVMWHCGFAVAVANARAEVKRDAHYVTPHSGGDGALRDAVEYILKAQGKWKQAVEGYIGERSPKGGH